MGGFDNAVNRAKNAGGATSPIREPAFPEKIYRFPQAENLTSAAGDLGFKCKGKRFYGFNPLQVCCLPFSRKANRSQGRDAKPRTDAACPRRQPGCRMGARPPGAVSRRERLRSCRV